MMENIMLVGSYAVDFEIPGTDGEVHHLANYIEKNQVVAVVFMSNKCHHVKAYLERLKQIQSDFASQGFSLIGINSNDCKQIPEDNFEQMKIFAQENELNFPYLRDTTEDIARGFEVIKTPTVFLIDKNWTIVYQGQIDDNWENPEQIKHRYLRDNIEALLKREAIKFEATEAIGCDVKLRLKN